VSLSTRLAIESERVTTDVIMVPMFPYLVVRHQVSDIPAVVVNGDAKITGPRAESDFVDQVLAAMTSR
jgi:hypothetical protein